MEEKKKDFNSFIRDVVSKILGYGLAIIFASIVLASFPSYPSFPGFAQIARKFGQAYRGVFRQKFAWVFVIAFQSPDYVNGLQDQ